MQSLVCIVSHGTPQPKNFQNHVMQNDLQLPLWNFRPEDDPEFETTTLWPNCLYLIMHPNTYSIHLIASILHYISLFKWCGVFLVQGFNDLTFSDQAFRGVEPSDRKRDTVVVRTVRRHRVFGVENLWLKKQLMVVQKSGLQLTLDSPSWGCFFWNIYIIYKVWAPSQVVCRISSNNSMIGY